MSGRTQADRLNPGYTITLVVTGDLPGEYVYAVSNRAMAFSETDSFGIQGKHVLNKLSAASWNKYMAP